MRLTDKGGCGGLGWATVQGSGYLSRRVAGQYTCGQTKILLNHVSCRCGSSRCGRAWLRDHGEGRDTLELRVAGQGSVRSKLGRTACDGI